MEYLVSDIILRSATEEDCRKMYEWRNHPQVRQGSISSEEITFAVHQEWFTRALHSASRRLLIASLENEAVGVLRFDFTGNRAEISIYLVPECIGNGLGQHLLNAAESWLKMHHPEVTHLVAKVLADNLRSQKTFKKAGFVPYLIELHKDF